MILAAPLLIPFAELAGISIGTLAGIAGLDLLSKKVESYIENNPENAQKIFNIIMPGQGLANILKNESGEGDEEVIETEEVTESEPRSKKEIVLEEVRRGRGGRGNFSSPDAVDGYVSTTGNVKRGLRDAGKIRKGPNPDYDPDKPKFNWKRFTRKKADGGMAGDKTYHQYHDQHVPMDLEGIMGYAHGGDIAIQGGVKNYLGEQKMVTVPQKWQSAEDHPQTELAYITNREKNLLLKKDLHDSLKGGANKGPEGVMSLNGWGDAPGGSKGGGKGGSSGGNNKFADYSYNKAERYATPKGVLIGPGGLRVGQGKNTTGALGTSGTGSNIDFANQKYSGDGIFSGYRNLDKFGQPKMGLAYGLDRLKNFIPSLMGMAMGIPGVGSATNFLKNKFGKGVVEEEQTISPYQLNSLGKYVYNEDPKNMFTDNFSGQKINNIKANVTLPNGQVINGNADGITNYGFDQEDGITNYGFDQEDGITNYGFDQEDGITNYGFDPFNNGDNLAGGGGGGSGYDTPTAGAYGFNLIELDRLQNAGYNPGEVSNWENREDVQNLIRSLEPARNGGMMGVGSMFVNKR